MKKLSNYIGSNCLKWRYNLIFITEKYDLEFHIEKFSQIASELSDYTDYCTINFIDLYKKVVRNFPQAREVEIEEQLIIGENFSNIAADYDIQIKTCLEGTLLDQFGCDSSGCMTQKVIERAIGNNLKSLKENIKTENVIVYLEEILEHIIHACMDANIVMPIVTKLSTTFLSLQILILFSSVIKILQFRSNGKILTDIQITNKLFCECIEIKLLS